MVSYDSLTLEGEFKNLYFGVVFKVVLSVIVIFNNLNKQPS